MRPRSVPISVEGYVGLPGAGKSYALSVRGLAAMKEGRRVFSNYGLAGTEAIRGWDCRNVGNTKDPGPSCECGRCFVSISNAVVLVDEINLWAPSRMWAALPLGLLHRWAQVRKYRTQILWSAQHEARVDKVIREVTGWVWMCRPVLMGRAFSLKAYEPSDLRHEGKRALDSQFLWLRRRVAESYDTMKLIDVGSQFGTTAMVPMRSEDIPELEADPWGLAPATMPGGALHARRYGASGWEGGDDRPAESGLVGVVHHDG